jgi:hypothetical protein
MAEHSRHRRSWLIILRTEQTAGDRLQPQRPIVPAGDERAMHSEPRTWRPHIEIDRTEPGHTVEDVVPAVEGLDDRVGEAVSAWARGAALSQVDLDHSCGLATGSDRSINASIRLKIAVLAPIPNASVKRITIVNAGFRANILTA